MIQHTFTLELDIFSNSCTEDLKDEIYDALEGMMTHVGCLRFIDHLQIEKS